MEASTSFSPITLACFLAVPVLVVYLGWIKFKPRYLSLGIFVVRADVSSAVYLACQRLELSGQGPAREDGHDAWRETQYLD